ncbi:unnamed protein product [Caenorhabditis sp. 36 PRJEB53466]|nr:unnamed protein product [Caenorhabditis sp. 36 PRJEB53466]
MNRKKKTKIQVPEGPLVTANATAIAPIPKSIDVKEQEEYLDLIEKKEVKTRNKWRREYKQKQVEAQKKKDVAIEEKRKRNLTKQELKEEQKAQLEAATLKHDPILRQTFPFHFDRNCLTFLGRVGEEAVTAYLLIHNPTKFPQMFKIKTSCNANIKVIPVTGCMAPYDFAEIQATFVGRHIPPPFYEFLTVHAIESHHFVPNVREAFKERSNFQSREIMYIDFAFIEDVERLMTARAEELKEMCASSINRMTNWTAVADQENKKLERVRQGIEAASPERTIRVTKSERAFEWKHKLETELRTQLPGPSDTNSAKKRRRKRRTKGV